MDLATYAVTAVLVEGRSVRAVAASTGRSKSWVARQVALYQGGGEAASRRRTRTGGRPRIAPRADSKT